LLLFGGRKMKKIMKKVIIIFLAIFIIVGGGIYVLFKHEISSLISLKKVDNYTLYTMEYDGNYGFDDFLQTGASNDSELVDFVVKKLLKGIPMEFSIPNLGCSTFNAQNTDGDFIFGRNFDLTYSPALFIKTKPDHGYASMSMVNLGFLDFNENKQPDSFLKKIITLAAPYAPLDGLNEKGLSIGVLLIPDDPTNQQTKKIDITTTTAVRLVLDKASTVEEAVKLLKQYDMHSSAKSNYHFQIADASGKSVVVEYIDNQISIVESSQTYQMATNFLLTKGDFNFGHGQDRYQVMKDILDEKHGIVKDENDAMNILEAVSQETHLNDAGEESSTQWSIIYNNTDLTARIVMGRQYDQAVHEFSLK